MFSDKIQQTVYLLLLYMRLFLFCVCTPMVTPLRRPLGVSLVSLIVGCMQ